MLILIITIFSATIESSSVDNTNGTTRKKQHHRHAHHAYGFNLTKSIISDYANLIYQRYEFHNFSRFQFFIESSNIPNFGWDLIKYKIARKILEGNATYLMIFGGSSVTAGHDNYYNQSYPFVFERRLRKVFTHLKIRLLVHNIAQGANNCRPSNLCYNSMGGENADFLGWEQSFNCGKDKSIFELIARIAYLNGAVIYYSASGAFAPTGCTPSTDKIPWILEDWTPEVVNITSKYELDETKVRNYRQLLNDWHGDGNSIGRFSGVYGHLYNGAGPHGYSVWGKSNTLCFNDLKNTTGCTAIDVAGVCHYQGGPHWMVQETSWYGKDDKQGKGWHPPTGMHMIRGEILAYNYLNIILDAIYMIENDLMNTTFEDKTALIKHYDNKWKELRVSIPENPLYCSHECKYIPNCYTNFEPHFNPKGLISHIIIGNHSNWNLIHKEGSWGTTDKKYGYKDYKHYYSSKVPKAEIYLKVENIRLNIIKLFAASKESLKYVSFHLDPNITIQSHTQSQFHAKSDSHVHSRVQEYIPSTQRYQLTNRKDSVEEVMLLDIPFGNHVLTIRAEPNLPGNGVLAAFTHIVTF
eukprot:gene15090-20305_t